MRGLGFFGKPCKAKGVFLFDSPKGLDNVRGLIKSQGVSVCVGGGGIVLPHYGEGPPAKKEKKLGRRIR